MADLECLASIGGGCLVEAFFREVMVKKRLLILATSYFPEEPSGTARLAYDLAREFSDDGHEVWLLTQAQATGVKPYVRDGEIHVLRYRLEPPRGLDLFRHVRHMHAVMGLLRQYVGTPPDVIHGHDLFTYAAALEFYVGSKPLTCYCIHSPAVEELPLGWRSQGTRGHLKVAFGLPIIRHYELRVLTNSNKIEAKSSFTRSRIEVRYGSDIGDRIQVIPGWIDEQRFGVLSPTQVQQARQKLDWPINQPVFFVLRRLEPRMGLDRFLYAVAQLVREGYDFFTAIAGAGPERRTLEVLLTQLNLESRVRLIGRIEDDVLPLAYGACDASVIPTRALECFGIIALESMATGRPALVTPVGALPEVVGAFEPAWIARSNEVGGIADLLRSFLRKELPAYQPQVISQYVSDHYSFHLVAQKYRGFLNI